MLIRYSVILTAALAAGLIGNTAQADFVSSLGVPSNFLEPTGWNVGDAGSTHQIWDAKGASAGNLPDQGYNTAGATLTDPTHSVKSPGFRTGTSSFYSFSGDFGATADIFNHGGPSAGLGTHVIVQIGSTVNPDEESFPGHGTSVYLDSLKLLDFSDSPLTGGANGDALQISEVLYQSEISTSFGPADYQELIFEFWLPGYTGDFRVDWDQKVHATIDTLRVDSIIAAETVGGGTPFATLATVPEPSSLVLFGITGIAFTPFALRRLRKRD